MHGLQSSGGTVSLFAFKKYGVSFCAEKRLRYTFRHLGVSKLKFPGIEDSALNVGYGKSESFEIRYPGGICYNAATEKTDEFYKLVEEADKAFKTVKEYIDLMDNAPELSARDFNMPYKLLAEFNGVVLGGIEHRSNNTFEFTTWSYANNSLYHGHYFTDYEKAKEDFAVRS